MAEDPTPRVAELFAWLGPLSASRVVDLGWGTDWQARSAYLALECSELTEAIRGKGTKPDPAGEAADVLYCLAAFVHLFDVDPQDIAEKVAERAAPEYVKRWSPDHARG